MGTRVGGSGQPSSKVKRQEIDGGDEDENHRDEHDELILQKEADGDVELQADAPAADDSQDGRRPDVHLPAIERVGEKLGERLHALWLGGGYPGGQEAGGPGPPGGPESQPEARGHAAGSKGPAAQHPAGPPDGVR